MVGAPERESRYDCFASVCKRTLFGLEEDRRGRSRISTWKSLEIESVPFIDVGWRAASQPAIKTSQRIEVEAAAACSYFDPKPPPRSPNPLIRSLISLSVFRLVSIAASGISRSTS